MAAGVLLHQTVVHDPNIPSPPVTARDVTAAKHKTLATFYSLNPQCPLLFY